MKKYAIVLDVLLIALSFSLYSCVGFSEKKHTPKEFLNHTIIKKDDYTKDVIEITRQLTSSLRKHEGFFYSKAYFDSTQIIVDSIIYSPDFNKLVVFVMTKNPTYRQLIPDQDHEWYYDATCYLGVRQNDTICLSRIGPNFSNSSDKRQLSNMMRDTYFTKYAAIRDTSGEYKYKYNIGDIRFWDCPIWKEIEEDKIKKKEFEETKAKHPEDVYEPKK